MGHSAGAAIVSTVLLHEPSLLDQDLKKRIKGAVLVSAPHHHNGRISMDPSVIQHYYGTPEQLATRVPFALLAHASDDTIANITKLLLVVSEKDPELVLTAHADFAKLARERLGEDSVSTRVAMGHNHISLTCAPSSGEGEEWAEDVVMWVKGA
jgi:pimeloyl-ACP methyl ester carboxylesterase